MVIKLVTQMELENINKQWNRSVIATKLAMKVVQLVNQEDAKIVSQIDSIVKMTKDTTMTPFETIKVAGDIRALRHYKHINIIIDYHPQGQHCKDIAVVQQTQILRPGSNEILVVLQNLFCRVLRIKKGTKIAHVEASNVVPPLTIPQLNENMPKEVAGNAPKGDLLESLPEGRDVGLKNFFKV